MKAHLSVEHDIDGEDIRYHEAGSVCGNDIQLGKIFFEKVGQMVHGVGDDKNDRLRTAASAVRKGVASQNNTMRYQS